MNPGSVVFWRADDVIRFGYVKERLVKYTEKDTIETYTVVDIHGTEFHPSENECFEYYYHTESMVTDIKLLLRNLYEPKGEVIVGPVKEGEVPF